jgi:hypothetical protein
MQCRHPFDREFMTKMFSRAFVDGEYRAHRENVLVDREMALLPDAQHAVANYRLADTLRELIANTGTLLDDLARIMRETRLQRERSGRQLHAIIASNYETDGTGAGTVTQEALRERARFLRGCPSEDCRGFITMQHVCGTCELRVCRTCIEPLGGDGDEHVCNPDTAATAALLRRDSRPCPSCATMITKVDGCDQMFCTVCHIAFSWRSGQIERGRIHNPHYYAWLRGQSATGEIPREPGDDGGCCRGDGDVPHFITVRNALQRVAALDPSSPRYIQVSDFHRELVHVTVVEIPALRHIDDIRRIQRTNMDLRLQYLVGNMTRHEWKRRLFMRERTTAKRVEQRQIYEMYAAVVGDNIRAFLGETKGFNDIIAEMKAVAVHANDAFQSVANRYACVAKRVYAGLRA